MKFDKRAIEAIGILGVVASLIFVGMQLMLDRKVSRADQYFNRSESRLATYRAQLESEAYIDWQIVLWENGVRPRWMSDELELLVPEFASTRNIVTHILNTTMNAIAYENLYFQYQQDMIPEDLWTNSREDLKMQILNPVTEAIYRESANNTELHELMDQLSLESN